MERPEASLEEYLDTLDWPTRQQVIRREGLWHLLPEEGVPLTPAAEPNPKGRSRQSRRR